MKLFLKASVFLLVFSQGFASDTPSPELISSVKDWTAKFPPNLAPSIEVVPDGPNGKPILQITVPEGEGQSWEGMIQRTLPPLGPGNYTVTFQAKADPGSASIEVSVWGSLPDREKKLGERVNCQAEPEWQEHLYTFAVDHTDPAAKIAFGKLARSGTTFFLSDLRLKKN